jgi:neprosin-like protein
MSAQGESYFPTFARFMDSVTSAEHHDYADRPAARVANVEQFNAMRQYIIDRYGGIEVAHSFVDENGQVFDCIPIRQQPSLKGTGAAPANAPDIAPEPGLTGDSHAMPIQPQLRSDRLDKYGHSMSCPPGTIPVRRITLEELARYQDMRSFFRKVPVGEGRHPRLGGPEIAANVHKYAHAYQGVNNLGGHSFLNVWDPAVGSQVFSLSQHWYAGGSPVQTVECGWQVYPGKYGTTQPVLFIYWTADGYNHTGCYNHDCSAFVQTNPNWAIGGTLAPVSVNGGAQYEIEMAYYLYQGNWWLYLGGTTASQAVGYYPASLFGAGPLASHATEIDYGGEVVDRTAWPPMGSGAFANAGWQHAAYQRDIYYYQSSGGARYASLTASQSSANCFTIIVNSAAAPWNEFFFFGGPGGTGCT